MPTAYVVRYDLDFAVRMECWENRPQALVRACQMLMHDLEAGIQRGLDDETVLEFLALVQEGKFEKATHLADDHMPLGGLTVESTNLNINPFLTGEVQKEASSLTRKFTEAS